MNRWRGKIAVVTGASAGIGAATVIELVKNGFTVVGVARREDKLKELQKKVADLGVGEFFPKQADISKEEDILELFRWIKVQFDKVHVLINNAGISRYGKLVEQNPKYWREILDTNVLGLSICTQQAIKLMRESKIDDGHIIHINSILGHQVAQMSVPITGMYAASKFAVTALTETLRQELRFLKSKIRVTSISPGIVNTEIGEAANKAMEEWERFDRSLLTGPDGSGRPSLKSQDVAEAIVYALSAPPHVQIHELTIKPVGEAI